MMTNTDVTLYQKSIVSRAEVWTRSEIVGTTEEYGAFWEDQKAVSKFLAADDVSIYIPDLSKVELLGILVGDVFVKGIVPDEITSEFTMTALKKKYPKTVVVRSVDTMDYGSDPMQHVQIGAS